MPPGPGGCIEPRDAKLIHLAEKFPKHPKLGGFSAKLDELVGVIQQFSKKLK